ncbi:MAG: aminotransferase class III-fold pyridoxal phosphate-dependent enzyme [Firmicutes bacterium]|nr:aminotransferase class III-fold pyridoxal phosphate-dependent enzyme [Bacillota bacterium]
MGNFKRHINPWLGEMLEHLHMNLDYEKGEGSFLYAKGKAYLDCVSAYGALPFGHNPPEIWAALEKVRSTARPNFMQPSALTPAAELAERLLSLAPPGLDYVTFTNSGAEAVEAAIKLARSATGRNKILTTSNSFHGKTLGALSATGKESYQAAFGAPVPGFDYIPFGDSHALAAYLEADSGKPAAFIVEPVQGEGGVVLPPAGYLKAVRELCSKHQVVLIVDEIQTGLGRTGRLFACETEAITPDVLLLAKALGGGLMPIGAVLSKKDFYSSEYGLKHSSTFAGGTLACEAGIAVLELLTADGQAMVKKAAETGAWLHQRLEVLTAPYDFVTVRGRGLMLGLEFNIDRNTHPHCLLGNLAEQQLLTPLVSSHLLNQHQVRVAPTLNGANVIRIQPPLTITETEAEQLLTALEQTLHLLDQGDTGALLSPLLADGSPTRLPRKRIPRQPQIPRGRKFAFLLHPLAANSFSEFDASLGQLKPEQLDVLIQDWQSELSPFVIGEAPIQSAAGVSATCQFINIPATAKQLMEMNPEASLALVRQGVELAREQGAELVGLGAFTSVVTWGGMRVRDVGVPLTTGNSYTVATAGEAVLQALERLGILPQRTTAAVVGASGSIGSALSHLLAESVGHLVLLGNPSNPQRSRQRLQAVADSICRHLLTEAPDSAIGQMLRRLQPPATTADDDTFTKFFVDAAKNIPITISVDADASLPRADVVATATNSVSELVTPGNVKFGAVVCDLSRPANVSREIKRLRPDVLVIDGGVVELWQRPDLGWNFGFEQGLGYACMAETMLLALEGHLQHTSIGSNIPMETVLMMRKLAQKHGFRVADLRSFDKPLSEADWQRVVRARNGHSKKVN